MNILLRLRRNVNGKLIEEGFLKLVDMTNEDRSLWEVGPRNSKPTEQELSDQKKILTKVGHYFRDILKTEIALRDEHVKNCKRFERLSKTIKFKVHLEVRF